MGKRIDFEVPEGALARACSTCGAPIAMGRYPSSGMVELAEWVRR